MGTLCVPAYANIFSATIFWKIKKKNGYISETRTNSKSKLTFPERQRVTAYFEEKFVYPSTENNISLYLRLIDDIIMVCAKSEKELLEFLNELNTKHTSIESAFKCSRQ